MAEVDSVHETPAVYQTEVKEPDDPLLRLRPFDSERGRIAGSKPKPNRHRELRHTLEMQDAMVEIATDKKAKPSERSQAARAWVDLYGARRIMLGHGAPKPIPASNDPALAKKIGRPRNQAETSDAPASESADSPE